MYPVGGYSPSDLILEIKKSSYKKVRLSVETTIIINVLLLRPSTFNVGIQVPFQLGQ